MNIRKSKKAQESSGSMIIYLIIAVAFAFILLFGYIIIKGWGEEEKEITSVELKTSLKSEVETLSTNFGSIREQTLIFPYGIDDICFTDLNERPSMLKSPVLGRWPLMKDSIRSGTRMNMFFFSTQLDKSDYIGNICYDHYPYYYCYKRQANLNLLLEGRGKCSRIVFDFITEKEITLDDDDRTLEDIHIFSYDKRFELIIRARTKINFPTNDHTIKIEPVPPPEGTLQKLLTEVYNISPASVTFDGEVILKSRYYSEMLHDSVKRTSLKIKKYLPETETWLNLEGEEADGVINTTEIDSLGYFSTFAPDAPVAIISEPVENQTFVVGEEINFSSKSYDPDKSRLEFEWDFGDETDIETSENPLHFYEEPGFYNVQLKVTDEDLMDAITSVNIIVNTNNKHKDTCFINGNRYVYVISNYDSSTKDNWREILQLIPFTVWNDNSEGINVCPFYVYYFGSSFDGPSITHIMGENSADFARFINEMPSGVPSGGVVHKEDLSANFYFSYWSQYDDVVVLDKNYRKAGLLSSLFASFLAAPIVLIGDDNLDEYKVYLDNKKVYIIYDPAVGEFPNNINVKNYIESNADSIKRYTLTDMQNIQINPYALLGSNILPSIYFE